MSLPAYAAQPVPDSRLDAYYNTIVIAGIQRSVALERAMPQPPVRLKPSVPEGDLKEVQEGVFVERSLMPHSQSNEERGPAIRVFPRDR